MAGAWEGQEAETSLDALAAAVRNAVAVIHQGHSTLPVAIPSTMGAFPNAPLGRVPPVVPDANVLRNDVLYACRHGRRTVLVNGAAEGLFRLFCAQHVIDEVWEHGPEWAAEKGIAPEAFLARWSETYLPLLRVVRDNHVPGDLLSPSETARIAELRRRDPDDVPSATLALLLAAYYMTEDQAALQATYGPYFDAEQHRAWLEALQAGGDAGELEVMLGVVSRLVALLGYGIATASRRAVQVIGPWGVLPLALFVIWLAKRATPETRKGLSTVISSSIVGFAAVFAAWKKAQDRFEQMGVKTPSWTQLAAVCDPNAVLARACLHALSRSGTSSLSAVQLAAALPKLPVAQTPERVRAILRSESCFTSTGRGRWQVGAADVDQTDASI